VDIIVSISLTATKGFMDLFLVSTTKDFINCFVAPFGHSHDIP
jgi:hypothetical protein